MLLKTFIWHTDQEKGMDPFLDPSLKGDLAGINRSRTYRPPYFLFPVYSRM